ncbi:hypothetical protein [Yoonia sp. 208BN28-4]|uniref:hypothetical protein n=1 Tax=Yoonia sp. 208BN28-4 TaxID=3126505 RepID=UPI0030AC4341
MKYIAALTVALGLSLSPVAAQTSDTEEGLDLLEEGAQLLLRGLMNEFEPEMDNLRALIDEFGPQIETMMIELGPRLELMMELVDNFDNYGEPEMLPNGDIIIRRNPDAPEVTPEISPEGEVEL